MPPAPLPMIRQRRGHAAAVGLTLLVGLLRWWLHPVLGGTAAFLPFTAVVAVSAWVGGLWPGLLATGLGGLVGFFVFVPPQFSFAIVEPSQAVAAVIFVAIGVTISLAYQALHRAHHQAWLAMQRHAVAEEQLRFALDVGGMVAWDWEVEGGGVQRSGSALGEMGLSDASVKADFLGLIHPQDLPRVRQMIDSAVRGQGTYRAEFRMRRPDGSWAWVADAGRTRVDPATGRLHFTGVLTDVTARKRAEEELARSRRQFEKIADATPDLLYVFDLRDGANRYVNRGIERVLGYTPEQVAAAGDQLMPSLLHPEDAPGVTQAVRRAMRMSDGDILETVARFRHADGSYRWLNCRDVVFERDPEAGIPVTIIGLAQDVTERLRVEAELRESESRFRRMADAMPQIVYVADARGKVEFINDRWTEYTGLSTDPCTHTNEPVHPEDREPLLLRWRESIENSTPYDAEFRLRGKDGIYRWFLTRSVPVLGENGHVEAWYGTSTEIHAQKETEAALRVSEERFRLAAEAVHGIIYDIDIATMRVFRSRGLRDVLGFDPEEAPPTVEWWRERCHPDDYAEQTAAGVRAIESGATELRSRYRALHRDGTWRWVEDRALLVRDAAGRPVRSVGCTVDITEQHREAADRQRRSEQVQRLAEVATRLNSIHEVPAILRVLGAEARELIGAHLSIVTRFEGEGEGASRPQFTASMSDRYAQFRQYDEPPDGRGIYRLVLESGRPMRLTEGQLRGHPAFQGLDGLGGHPPLRGWLAAPLSAPRSEARAVIQLSDKYEGDFTADDEAVLVQLTQMASSAIANAALVESLRDADRRKDEFLATLAHELRNPLAPIRNGLQVLRLAPGSEQASSARDVMERQLAQMVRLVDDLLDVSRITRGKLELRRARLDLRSALGSAIETARPLIDRGGHRFDYRPPPGPLWVEGDLVRLGQVVANLLNNAAKYTPPCGQICLSAAAAGPEWAVVTVQDNGVGIPPAMREKVFELFTQADRALEKATGGLGIGLSLVRGLVEMHGGSVGVEANPAGRGSVFTVRLPLCGVAPAPEPAHPPEAAGGEPTRDGSRILVVDDNVDAADSMAQLLQLIGYEVRTAHDGAAGVAAAEEFRPDLVLMDIGMPKLNGHDAARRIRDRDWGRSIPLVALTGWGQEADRRNSQEAGFTRHLVKPVDPEQLVALLRDLLLGP